MWHLNRFISVSINRQRDVSISRKRGHTSFASYGKGLFVFALVVAISLVAVADAFDAREQDYLASAPPKTSGIKRFFNKMGRFMKGLVVTTSPEEKLDRQIQEDYDTDNFHTITPGTCSKCREVVGDTPDNVPVVWAPYGEVVKTCGHVYCLNCVKGMTHCSKIGCDREGVAGGTFPSVDMVPASVELRYGEESEKEEDFEPEKPEGSEEAASEEKEKEEMEEGKKEGKEEEGPTDAWATGSDVPIESESDEGLSTTTTPPPPEKEYEFVEARETEAEIEPKEPMPAPQPETYERPTAPPVYTYVPPQAALDATATCSYCGDVKRPAQLHSLIPIDNGSYLSLHGDVICDRCALNQKACQKPECQEKEIQRLNRLRGVTSPTVSESEESSEEISYREFADYPQREETTSTSTTTTTTTTTPSTTTPAPVLPPVHIPHHRRHRTRSRETVTIDETEYISSRKHLTVEPRTPVAWTLDTDDAMLNHENEDAVLPFDGYIKIRETKEYTEDSYTPDPQELDPTIFPKYVPPPTPKQPMEVYAEEEEVSERILDDTPQEISEEMSEEIVEERVEETSEDKKHHKSHATSEYLMAEPYSDEMNNEWSDDYRRSTRSATRDEEEYQPPVETKHRHHSTKSAEDIVRSIEEEVEVQTQQRKDDEVIEQVIPVWNSKKPQPPSDELCTRCHGLLLRHLRKNLLCDLCRDNVREYSKLTMAAPGA